jgi:hypothetical protein
MALLVVAYPLLGPADAIWIQAIRAQPPTGHEAETRKAYSPSVGHEAEKCLSQQMRCAI